MEVDFLTTLKHAFKKHGAFYFKLPDADRAARFMIPKPCDSIICLDGHFIGLEGKFSRNPEPFGMKDLRESQKTGLQAVLNAKGVSLVALEVKTLKRAYFWPYDYIKKVNLLQPSELNNFGLYCTKQKDTYDISNVLEFVWGEIFKNKLL